MARKWIWLPLPPLSRWAVGIFVAGGVALLVAKSTNPGGALCATYQRAIHAISGPGFIPNDDCFFKKMASVANYSVGNINFSVPRDYFWLGKTKDDGPLDSIYILFHIPDMSPASSYGDQGGNIIIEVNNCKRDKCVLDPMLADRARERVCIDPPGGVVSWPPRFKQIPHEGYEIFYYGNLCDPEQSMVCDGENTVLSNRRCEYKFHLSEKVNVRIGFRKNDMFGKTNHMRNAVDKLRSFVSSGALIQNKTWGGE